MDNSREKTREEFRFEVAPETPEKKPPLWKNARAAVAAVAVVCAIATAFGAHRSVAAQRRTVTEAFYQGADGTGYSISRLLDDRVEYATYLVKLAGQYPELVDAADAVSRAAGTLAGAKDAGEAGAANLALTETVTALDLAMQSAALSERDEAYRAEYVADLSGLDLKISHLTPAYNALAREFNEGTLGAFPLGALARRTGVEPVEEYRG